MLMACLSQRWIHFAIMLFTFTEEETAFSIMNPNPKTIPENEHVHDSASYMCRVGRNMHVMAAMCSFYLLIPELINKYEKNMICIFKNCWKFNDVWFKLATTGINQRWGGGHVHKLGCILNEGGLRWVGNQVVQLLSEFMFHVAAEFQSREVHNVTLRKKTHTKKIGLELRHHCF